MKKRYAALSIFLAVILLVMSACASEQPRQVEGNNGEEQNDSEQTKQTWHIKNCTVMLNGTVQPEVNVKFYYKSQYANDAFWVMPLLAVLDMLGFEHTSEQNGLITVSGNGYQCTLDLERQEFYLKDQEIQDDLLMVFGSNDCPYLTFYADNGELYVENFRLFRVFDALDIHCAFNWNFETGTLNLVQS